VWAAFACGLFLLAIAAALFFYGRIAPRRKPVTRQVDIDPRARAPKPQTHNGEAQHETPRSAAEPRPAT
jgi:hypothetical protein